VKGEKVYILDAAVLKELGASAYARVTPAASTDD
jgi:hypothetical protein